MVKSTLNRYKNKILLILFLIGNSILLTPFKVLADDSLEGPYTADDSEGFERAVDNIQDNMERILIADRDEDLLTVLTELLNLAITFIGVIAIIFLIVGGIKYITAGGDESKTEEANKTIINALVGLVIVLLSGIIVRFVISVLV